MPADPATLRRFAVDALAGAVLDEIVGDGRVLSLAVTVIEPDQTVVQYLVSLVKPGVSRLIIPPDRFADLNRLREQMVDVTPPDNLDGVTGGQ